MKLSRYKFMSDIQMLNAFLREKGLMEEFRAFAKEEAEWRLEKNEC